MLTASDIPTKVKNKELVEKRRAQIIIAAINLFTRTKRGLNRTTLREIADVCGISHGNIYDYMRSKEDLLFLMHDFINDVICESIDRVSQNIDQPFEKLRRMIKCESEFSYQMTDAILLIYQETQLLFKNEDLLKSVLGKERQHHERYEAVLEKGIKKGVFRDLNPRLVANLIKIMAECWALKRWDLRGHVTQLQMEKSILDLVFYGILCQERPSSPVQPEMDSLEGKVALVIGRSLLAKSIIAHLLSKGAKVAFQEFAQGSDGDFFGPCVYPFGERETSSVKYQGDLTADLFEQIASDFGRIDILIYDLGITDSGVKSMGYNARSAGEILEGNFQKAHLLAPYIERKMREQGSGKVIYVTPWAWDRFLDPMYYETVKAGTVALTRIVAKEVAAAGVCVNCIVPGFIGGVRPSDMEMERGGEVVKEIPMGRIGNISDILETLNFLISDTSKYLTGQTLELGGGFT